MAYTINKLRSEPGQSLIGERIDSGQTREQVLNALAVHGLMPENRALLKSLPRFGKMLIICGPGLRASFCIVHQ